MDGILVAAALLSAALHAAWNAWVKAAPDPQDAMAAQVIGAGLASAALLVVVPLPPPASLPWLASSTLLNLLILGALVRGYALGGFGFVYPVARAVSPLLVALFATLLVGERLSPTGWAGVALVSGAVAVFASGEALRRPAALVYALAAGALSAAYVLSDAQGARLSPSVLGYGLSLSVLSALACAALLRRRGGRVRAVLCAHRGLATLGAGAAIASYLLILWVWSRGPIALGAALRDTSVVFAGLLAALVLREPLTPRRAGALLLALAGMACLRVA